MTFSAPYAKIARVSAAALLSVVLCGPAAWAATARENYRYFCAPCHGAEGKGNGPNATDTQPVRPRNHTSAAEMSKLTDQEILDVIRHGGAATSKSRMMPPFEKTLTGGEIKDLLGYLRKLCNCKGK